jgi:hypothetical protein
LDSRFSRDKYDLSDEQNTDGDEDEHIQKPINGLSSSPTHVHRSSEPYHVDNNYISQIQHPIDEIDKGRSLKKQVEGQTKRVACFYFYKIIITIEYFFFPFYLIEFAHRVD